MEGEQIENDACMSVCVCVLEVRESVRSYGSWASLLYFGLAFPFFVCRLNNSKNEFGSKKLSPFHF